MVNKTSGRHLSLRATQLALAIAAAFGSSFAYAQEAAPAKPETADKPAAKSSDIKQLDAVEVVGTRKSIESAINRKRNGGTVSDSIVAEDIGQFPDKNVGEALSRVTGVQLTGTRPNN